jgi:hypothetical protein
LRPQRIYFTYAARLGTSAHRVARRRLLHLRHASGCLGTSRGSLHGSLHGSSSTIAPTPRVRVTRNLAWFVARLVVDYFAYAARPCASARRAARRVAHRATRRRLLHLRHTTGCFGTSRGSSMTTSRTSRVRVPRHVARLVTRLVVDCCTYVGRPGASARRVARRTARRVARFRLLRLHRASGCLGTSRGSSRRSSSTTSPTPRVRVPRLLTRLVVYHASSCRSTSRRSVALALVVLPVVRLAARLLCALSLDLLFGRTGSTSATPCITTTCLAATPALLRVRRTPPRHRLPYASRRLLILTSFPN